MEIKYYRLLCAITALLLLQACATYKAQYKYEQRRAYGYIKVIVRI